MTGHCGLIGRWMLLPFAVLIVCASLCGSASAQDSLEDDWRALIAIYNATVGDSWQQNTNWSTSTGTPPGVSDLDDWYGVTVDMELERVTGLELPSNSLAGLIPSELWSLTELVKLDFGGASNVGLGGSIPPEIGNLTALRFLAIFNTSISGELPAEIGNLTDLEYLNIRHNQLTGSLPASMVNLSKLSTLYFIGQSLCAPYTDEFNLWLRDVSSARGPQCPVPRLASHTETRVRCVGGKAAEFDCSNVDLLSHLSKEDLGAEPDILVNDIWGWTDTETGREYALVGKENGVAIVDVTNSVNPVYLGSLPSHDPEAVVIWRDMKVYRDYMFVVADAYESSNGLQIFDLTQLRSVDRANLPATFVETANYQGMGSAHNVFIHEEAGYAYLAGSRGGSGNCGLGLHIVDVRDPLNPTFVGCHDEPRVSYGPGYAHDVQCVTYHGPDETYRGREICVASGVTAVNIVDVTDKSNTVSIAVMKYPQVTYSHQGWLTEDHGYFIANDELDEVYWPDQLRGSRTLIWDLTDLDDPILFREYFSSILTVDHNLYVKGKHVYQTNYESGLRILDIEYITDPVEVAYFDTDPASDKLAYDYGAWSSFPYFPSGNVVVSSMVQGLFVLRPTMIECTSSVEGAHDRYAARNADTGASNDCTDPRSPCSLQHAINVAESGLDPVRVRLRESGATTTIHEDLDFSKEIGLGAYVASDPKACASGTVRLLGDVYFGAGARLYAVDNQTEVHLLSREIEIAAAARIALPNLVMGHDGNEQEVEVRGEACTRSASVQNLTVVGDVRVREECVETATLTITNSLVVSAGTLDLGGVNLAVEVDAPRTAGPTAVPGRVAIAPGAAVSGGEQFILRPEEEASQLGIDAKDQKTYTVPEGYDYSRGRAFPNSESTVGVVREVVQSRVNPAVDSLVVVALYVSTGGFANNPAGCFAVSGEGSLSMDIRKEGNSGACVTLGSIGGGGISVNAGGTLYVTKATKLNGSFRQEGAARTEFWNLQHLAGDLEITGPGGAVGPVNIEAHSTCDGGGSTGRSGGVHFFSPVTIEQDVMLENTDNPDTECLEGLVFRGDATPSLDGGSATPEKEKDTHASVVLGAFEAKGRSAVSLGGHNFFHNVAFENDFQAEELVTFSLAQHATSVGASGLCSVDPGFGVHGNRIVFAGDAAQDIRLAGDVMVPGISIAKADGATVTIDQGGTLVVGTLLELASGMLETNGMLNAAGATLAIHQGVLSKGESDFAYRTALNERPSVPRRIVYAGQGAQRTGDELADAARSDTVEVGILEISKSPDSAITLRQTVLVTDSLRLYSGRLLSDKAALALAKDITVELGDGDVEAVVLPDSGDINLRYVGTGARLAGSLWPASSEPVRSRVSNVAIDGVCRDANPTVRLNEGYSWLGGNLELRRGALDLEGQSLVVFASEDLVNQTVTIGEKGYLCDSSGSVACTVAGSGAEESVTDQVANALARYRESRFRFGRDSLKAGLDALGELRETAGPVATTARMLFVGNGDTGFTVQTSAERLRYHLPAVVVRRNLDSDAERQGTVTLSVHDAGPLAPVPVLTMTELTVEHGRAAMGASLDALDILGGLTIVDGAFEMPVSTEVGMGSQGRKSLRVGTSETLGDLVQREGTFLARGGVVTVFGDFVQGAEPDSLGTEPGASATFDLGGGRHEVMGDFRVGPGAGEVPNRYAMGGACLSTGTRSEDQDSGLWLAGHYHFAGDGDISGGSNAGLRGMVRFVGTGTQEVWHRLAPAAMFCDVTVASAGDEGVALKSDATQNALGMLTLRHGVVDAANWRWTLARPHIEDSLFGRTGVVSGARGTVYRGSRDSYIRGRLARMIAVGSATGGAVTSGYIFPVGTARDTTAERVVDAYRPLILQLSADEVAVPNSATVQYLDAMTAADMEWPEAGLVVDGPDGSTLQLDVVADMLWKVEFDRIPVHDPNLRMAASGLVNVFDIKSLRLVQWDCDGTNPRLAGIYDLESGSGLDDGSYAANDFVNGVPNLSQEGVGFSTCNIIGVASNLLLNPISLDLVQGPLAQVQFIQNQADAVVDVYLDGVRILNDWGFQSATGFVPVASGERRLEIVAAAAPDNADPALTRLVQLQRDASHHVVLHGDAHRPSLVAVGGVRRAVEQEGTAEFYLVHGAQGVGEVDIRLLNPVTNDHVIALLANNLGFNDESTYVSLAPGGYNMEVTTSDNARQIAVWRLELGSLQGEVLVLGLSGPGKVGAATIMTVAEDGSVRTADNITGVEIGQELPQEFALRGNYPNPFNPSTRIEFDLPEVAHVSVEVVDMLGRSLMAVPAKEFEAGRARQIEFSVGSLASGTYFYRIRAVSAAQVWTGTGRMMLVR